MVDNRASHLVRNLKASGQDKAISQQQVKKCCCGCPLDATIDYGGQNTCSYHSQQDSRYWDEITMAINNNLDLIKKHAQMTRWTIKEWKNQYSTLEKFHLCSMTESDRDRLTIYLNKFSKALRDKILDESRESGGQHD